MEDFEIKQLVAINGMPGLYKIKSPVKIKDSVLVERLTRPGDLVPVNYKKNQITPLNGVVIYLKPDTSGAERSTIHVEHVIEKLYELELDGETIPLNMDSVPVSEDFMELVVPNYDDTMFKKYHMDKILKWYAEIANALRMLENENED
jgi:hypothetical protein